MSLFQTTLVGKLVTIRPLTEMDRDELYLPASDPKVWEQHPQSDRYKREVFDSLFDTLLTFVGPMAVIENATGKIIGTSNFYDFDSSGKSVCIGYTFIGRNYWGHTYNKEMKSLMIDHAYRVVDTVYFHIGEKNIRSQVAIKKIGAEECGETLKLMPDGTPAKSKIYRLTKRK